MRPFPQPCVNATNQAVPFYHETDRNLIYILHQTPKERIFFQKISASSLKSQQIHKKKKSKSSQNEVFPEVNNQQKKQSIHSKYWIHQNGSTQMRPSIDKSKTQKNHQKPQIHEKMKVFQNLSLNIQQKTSQFILNTESIKMSQPIWVTTHTAAQLINQLINPKSHRTISKNKKSNHPYIYTQAQWIELNQKDKRWTQTKTDCLSYELSVLNWLYRIDLLSDPSHFCVSLFSSLFLLLVWNQ